MYIGSDHAGFKLKEKIKKYLAKKGVKVLDLGVDVFNPKDDYPLFAKKLAKAVAGDKNGRGIIICGTGLGSCIVANKIKGVRATSAWNKKSAQQAREHLNSNVLCLGARIQSFEDAKEVVEVWLQTEFSEEKRHQKRIKMISAIER